MTIGNRIREIRISCGYTQEELAHKVGYASRVSINKIELQRDVPISKLKKIADALNVSVPYLMGWETSSDEELFCICKKLNEENKLNVKKIASALLLAQEES